MNKYEYCYKMDIIFYFDDKTERLFRQIKKIG